MDTVIVARARGAQAAGPAHEFSVSRRQAAIWYGGFTVYAGTLAVFTGHADRQWALWAVGAYAATTVLLLLTKNWLPPLIVALGGALAAPLAWLATHAPATAEVQVIGRSASLLLRHGTPYLPASQLSGWTSYNPYLPMMEIFGLPRSVGLTGLAGDPRVWLSAVTIALLWLAFAALAPHATVHCARCRAEALLATALATASPVMAFPLALGITDPPVIALLCLALACTWRGWLPRAGLVVGAACAMKATAWPVIPVLGLMIAVRYASRTATAFAALAIGLTGVLAVAAAPAVMTEPTAMLQNTVAFPLGLARHKTPAASPLPGHLLAELGTAGHWLAVCLMIVAAVGYSVWLVLRPPGGVGPATWRLAVGYAIMFGLAPATRWGYFAYPAGLLGWLYLASGLRTTDQEGPDKPEETERVVAPV